MPDCKLVHVPSNREGAFGTAIPWCNTHHCEMSAIHNECPLGEIEHRLEREIEKLTSRLSWLELQLGVE